jgi:hypothetical protein
MQNNYRDIETVRLWSIHPKYLDAKGLVALWREALLAQAVLAGETIGYRNHPQLDRFKKTSDPESAISTYLWGVYQESLQRGYDFDKSKILRPVGRERIEVTKGQIAYEMEHLKNKLKLRDEVAFNKIEGTRLLKAHPMFDLVAGKVEDWERIG